MQNELDDPDTLHFENLPNRRHGNKFTIFESHEPLKFFGIHSGNPYIVVSLIVFDGKNWEFVDGHF